MTAFLVNIGWNRYGLGEQFWTVAVICLAISLSLIILFRRKDIFYVLVVDWALLGILFKRISVDATPTLSVAIISVVGMSFLTFGILFQLIRGKVY